MLWDAPLSSARQSGIPRGGGGGARSAPIAGIADIARNRRDRKGKSLPLINADDADRNKAGNVEATPISAHPRENRAQTGPLGMALG